MSKRSPRVANQSQFCPDHRRHFKCLSRTGGIVERSQSFGKVALSLRDTKRGAAVIIPVLRREAGIVIPRCRMGTLASPGFCLQVGTGKSAHPTGTFLLAARLRPSRADVAARHGVLTDITQRATPIGRVRSQWQTRPDRVRHQTD